MINSKIERAILLVKIFAVVILVYRCFSARPLDDEAAVIYSLDNQNFRDYLYALPSAPFYIFHFLYSIFGESFISFRLISIAPMLVIISISEKMLRGSGSVVRLIFWLWFALHPLQLLWYPFARFYCLLAMFFTLCFHFLYQILRGQDRTSTYIWLSLTLGLAPYFHYSSFWLWVATALLLFVFLFGEKIKTRKMILVLLAASVIALPNIVYVAGAVIGDQMTATGGVSMRGYILNTGLVPFQLIAGETVYPWEWTVTITSALIAVYCVIRALGTAGPARTLFVILVMTVIGMMLYDIKHAGMLRGRYLVLVVPAVLTYICLLFNDKPGQLAVLSLFILPVTLYSDFNLFSERHYWKEGLTDRWEEVIADLAKDSESGRVLVVSGSVTFNYCAKQSGKFELLAAPPYYWNNKDFRNHVVAMSGNYDRITFLNTIAAESEKLEKPFIDGIIADIRDKFRECSVKLYFRHPALDELRKYVRADYPEWRVRVSTLSR